MTTTTEQQMDLFPTATTEARRFLGRCKTCKTVQCVEVDDRNEWRYGRPCCGRTLQLVAVRGTVKQSKKCDGRCTHAVSSHCECQCGGANHGRWFA